MKKIIINSFISLSLLFCSINAKPRALTPPSTPTELSASQLLLIEPFIPEDQNSLKQTTTSEFLAGYMNSKKPSLYIDLSLFPDLTDDDLINIARANTLLEYLNISGSQITDTGLIGLSQYCQSLKSLDLSNCTLITDRGLTALLSVSHNLENLNLENCTNVTEQSLNSISQLVIKKLKTLNIIGCNVTNDFLVDFLKNCKNIERLSIGGMSLNDSVIRTIADYCKKLIELNIKQLTDFYNYVSVQPTNPPQFISTEALNYLLSNINRTSIINSGSKLQKLCISNCRNLDDSCIEVISERCKNSLKFLDLSFSDLLTNLSLQYLGKLKKLEFLILEGCPNINNILAIVGAGYPKLRYLDVTDCYSILATDIQNLKNSLSKITIKKGSQKY
ncbi:hypothetical protein K9L05_01375 [Candidatus Babeliales bacterium]|nr:hypothetical protein [Candidatus Babeliales bacterium]MCF7899282.1 hypothetical protein [Candidatus Babeliales bacterium]